MLVNSTFNPQLLPLIYQVILNAPGIIDNVVSYGEGEGKTIIKYFLLMIGTIYSYSLLYFEYYGTELKVNDDNTGQLQSCETPIRCFATMISIGVLHWSGLEKYLIYHGYEKTSLARSWFDNFFFFFIKVFALRQILV